jgi:adenosylmethionine-8-amino-7-oxononanoate aminotransferase
MFVEAAESLRDHPVTGEVRTAGLLCGVGLDAERVAANSELASQIVLAARSKGLLTRALGLTGVQVSPALVIEPHEIERLFSLLRGALDSVHRDGR